jgi:serine/threonine-protein kinase
MENELGHGPQMLPDGKTVLFTLSTSTSWDEAQIVTQSLETGERRVLIEGGTDARYVPTGHLVYALGETLLAVPFDLERLDVTGGSVPVVEGVARASGFRTGAAHASFSDSGSLVYVRGLAQANARLVWVDREGREEALAAEPRAYTYPRISPDGSQVALDVRDQESDIWVWDLARETLRRLTFDPGADRLPIWTPDGQRVAFGSGRDGTINLFWKAADGTGTVERLTESENAQHSYVFSPDGKQLVYREIHPQRGSDLGVLSLEGDGSFGLLLVTEFSEQNAEISPDGRRLAYQSNASGQHEIYVRPFPGVDEGRWQISTGGGIKPVWAPDGRELFYVNPDGQLMAVSVRIDPSVTFGSPEVVFEESYFDPLAGGGGRTYDVSPDGERFLMIKADAAGDEAAAPELILVLNWFEELKRLVPTN